MESSKDRWKIQVGPETRQGSAHPLTRTFSRPLTFNLRPVHERLTGGRRYLANEPIRLTLVPASASVGVVNEYRPAPRRIFCHP